MRRKLSSNKLPQAHTQATPFKKCTGRQKDEGRGEATKSFLSRHPQASQKALHRESLRSWRKQKELLITHLIPHFFRMEGQGILHFFSFFFCGHFTFECFFMFVDFYTFMLSPRVQNKIPALRKIKFFKKIQCFKNIQIFKKFKFSK